MRLFTLASLSILTLSGAADAKEDAWSTSLRLGVGTTNASRELPDAPAFESTLVFGADFTRQLGPWHLGLGADLGKVLFGSSHVHFGALAGTRFAPLPWLTLDLLAEAGGHQMWDLAGSSFGRLFRDMSGDAALLPFAGLRAGATVRLGSVAQVGLWALGRRDLFRRDVRVEDKDCSLEQIRLAGPAPACTPSKVTFHAGGTDLSAGLSLGLAF